eukprot:CAMPEP_0184657566 /NCGR_PEP_ID=MMETSP0308-20130426/20308_1 /TAXON_ID=38269 /ORGANISM="Gloeochaete witrockiana, Strain SAG 46.84" /LENGTH=307 /DNA_ID=CAMNT_0027095537 /DNA_START=224 /DNA_END=1147 /DNA_ORIENTATION=-
MQAGLLLDFKKERVKLIKDIKLLLQSSYAEDAGVSVADLRGQDMDLLAFRIIEMALSKDMDLKSVVLSAIDRVYAGPSIAPEHLTEHDYRETMHAVVDPFHLPIPPRLPSVPGSFRPEYGSLRLHTMYHQQPQINRGAAAHVSFLPEWAQPLPAHMPSGVRGAANAQEAVVNISPRRKLRELPRPQLALNASQALLDDIKMRRETLEGELDDLLHTYEDLLMQQRSSTSFVEANRSTHPLSTATKKGLRTGRESPWGIPDESDELPTRDAGRGRTELETGEMMGSTLDLSNFDLSKLLQTPKMSHAT